MFYPKCMLQIYKKKKPTHVYIKLQGSKLRTNARIAMPPHEYQYIMLCKQLILDYHTKLGWGVHCRFTKEKLSYLILKKLWCRGSTLFKVNFKVTTVKQMQNWDRYVIWQTIMPLAIRFPSDKHNEVGFTLPSSLIMEGHYLYVRKINN